MPISSRNFSRCAALGLAAAACAIPFAQATAQPATGTSQINSPNLATRSAKFTTSKGTGSRKSAESVAVEISTIVKETLVRNPYYFPGALISRDDVSPVFEKLLRLGVIDAEDQEDLYGSVLSDSSPLVRRLKTPVGRAFMKKIASDPTAYDRLERISWTIDGRKLLDRFLNSKDGVEQFQRLKTPADLARVSKQLAADPHTADFAQPTGHILTADQLIQKLQELAASRNPPQKPDATRPAR
jgi:hypothetical protein